MAGPRSEPPMPMLTTAVIRLPVWPVHWPERMAVGHLTHPVEHLVHVGHHVLPVDLEVGAPRHPQGHVEHGPVLGGVDVAAGEHGVAALFHAGPAGHGHQCGQGLVVDPVLGVVEVEVAGRHRHPGAPIGIVGEELPEVATVPDRSEAGSTESPPLVGGPCRSSARWCPLRSSLPSAVSFTSSALPASPACGRRLPIIHLSVTRRLRHVHLAFLGWEGMAANHDTEC